MVAVVATTHWNGTYSMLTSAKLTEGYLVVGITRELDKEPLLHYSSIYINTIWSVLQQYLPVLISMHCPYILLLIHYASISRPPYYVHVPWHHTFNLYCTCAYYVYTMRNHCPLTSSLTLTPSRLFLIFLDPKSFQTALDYSSFYHMTSRSHALSLL